MINKCCDIISEIELIKDDKELSFDERDRNIEELLEGYSSPIKEVLSIISSFGKCYSVPKVKREFLINCSSMCLESNELDAVFKHRIKVSLFDALYKNFDFCLAEELVKEISDSELNDYVIFYQLGEYYILTRRYDSALDCLNKALSSCLDDGFIVMIEKKIDECKKRSLGKENGGSSPYMPSDEVNRVKYCDFMNSIGIEVVMPRVRAKAPEKISIEDYPAVCEITAAGFKSFVAFDVETTGLDHSRDSIIELSAIRVVDGVVVEEKEFIFSEFVHPYKVKISKTVEELTGISNEMVHDSREIWEVFKDFAEWLGDDILLGYNCSTFDSKFMVRAGRLSNVVLTNKYFDAMKLARKKKALLSSENLKLVNVAESLGIINPQAHRALADAITTAKVYLALLEL